MVDGLERHCSVNAQILLMMAVEPANFVLNVGQIRQYEMRLMVWNVKMSAGLLLLPVMRTIFLIKAKPFHYKNHKYVLLSALDISDTKRRETLERVFFHDIMNTAGGLLGFAEILKMDLHNDSFDMIYDLSDRLIKEIKFHRMLLSAENGVLELEVIEFNLRLFLEKIKQITEKNSAISHVKIVMKDIEEGYIITDQILLQRVLINMVKNAAEASDHGDEVTITSKFSTDHVLISVHNPTYIPPDTQLQIFQRSFSTKGVGRGIGTYSMKLFGEKYLKGTVDFFSVKDKGTTVFIDIPTKLEKQGDYDGISKLER